MEQVNSLCRGALALLFGLAVFTTGCTREVSRQASISIEMPSSLASLSVTEKLEQVIVNARATTTSAPKVWEFEFRDSSQSYVMGQTVPIIVQGDIPSSSTLLVQVLGIFEGPNGTMRFVYGDSTVDSTVSGDIPVTITTAVFGSSAREGRVGGRYITADTPAVAGPTGDVITLFAPPGGRPDMAVMKDDIINGWFNVMVLDGTQTSSSISLKYLILQEGKPNEYLFASAMALPNSRMNLSHPLFNNESAYLTQHNLYNTGSDAIARTAKIFMPVHWRLETFGGGSSSFEKESEMEVIAGFFRKNNAVVAGTFSSKKGCTPEFATAIPYMLADSNSDGMPDTPLGYAPANTPPHAYKVYGESGASCVSGVLYQDKLNLYAQRLSDSHGGNAYGVTGPFALIDENNHSSSHEGYLNISIDNSSANPKAVLKWKYLPDVAPAHVSGLSIYMKPHSSDGDYGGGRDDKSCDQQALEEGMTYVTDAVGSIEAKTIASPPGYSNFSNNHNATNSIYNYYYMACPYRVTAAGTKKYYLEGIRSGCVGGCSDSIMSFGSKIPGYSGHDVSLSSSAWEFADGSNIKGATARISDVSAVDTTGVTLTLPGGYGNLISGSEVMIYITSASGSPGCLGDDGVTYQPGQFAFTRLIGTGPVKIQRGTFLDNFLNTDMDDPTTLSIHCYVQLVQVAEFGNLTLQSGAQLYPSLFDGGPNGGGIMVLRVNGTLTLEDSTSIHADGKGFQCLTGSSPCHGNGPGGSLSNASPDSNRGGGGGSHMSAGSGGNGGSYDGTPGGIGAVAGGGGGGGGFFQLPPPFMGGAGGGSAISIGGRGGGVVWIFARKILATGATYIRANGEAGSGGTSSSGPGGGAGGTVYISSHKVDVSGGDLEVSADGGTGIVYNDIRGGGGGGGFAEISKCAVSGANLNVYAVGGLLDTDPGAYEVTKAGLGTNGTTASNNLPWVCPPSGSF